MEREDISWIGIDIKGTNLIVKINEADKSPEVIDVNEVCNIVADKSGEISKLLVKQGTARVEVGDEVKERRFISRRSDGRTVYRYQICSCKSEK